MTDCQVYLVPGFFGFTTLGSVSYFHRVAETLTAALRAHGIRTRVVECPTQPTGSIKNRADRLLDIVVEQGCLDCPSLHFVGHSTGGLDIRLLVTPGVRLRRDDVEERIAHRTRSVITLSTPHHGTPLAGFFTTLQGRQVLRLLTVMATSAGGRHVLFLAAQAASQIATADDRLGLKNTLLDSAADRLLRTLTPGRDDPLWGFLKKVSEDQGAIVQLTPEGMHLFTAAVVDRPGVQYGSVVSAAPGLTQGFHARDLLSPTRAMLLGLFGALHALTGREHRSYRYPTPEPGVWRRLQAALPFAVDATANDGIVPLLSQLHGELIDVVLGDHLDLVGQFREAGGNQYADWLPSGSEFDEERFRGVWSSVAAAIASSQLGQ